MASLALLGASAPALACGGSSCSNADFVPATGEVPANLAAIQWWPARDLTIEEGPAPSAADVRFVRLGAENEAPTPVAFTLSAAGAVVPSSPLEVGARYAVWSAISCGGELPEEVPLERLEAFSYSPYRHPGLSVFTVSAAANLPDSLGALTAYPSVKREVELPTASGSCGAERQAVTAKVELAAPTPWHDALVFTTWVDDKPYYASAVINDSPPPGSSWRGRGVDEIYLECEDEDGVPTTVTSAIHRVKLVATLPGTDVRLESSEVTVTLDCDHAPPDDDWDYCGVTDDEEPVGNQPTEDATAFDDERQESDSVAPRKTEARPNDSGCTLAPTPSGDSLGALWVLLAAVLGLVPVRARRRARVETI
jgi:hypothetical protein